MLLGKRFKFFKSKKLLQQCPILFQLANIWLSWPIPFSTVCLASPTSNHSLTQSEQCNSLQQHSPTSPLVIILDFGISLWSRRNQSKWKASYNNSDHQFHHPSFSTFRRYNYSNSTLYIQTFEHRLPEQLYKDHTVCALLQLPRVFILKETLEKWLEGNK